MSTFGTDAVLAIDGGGSGCRLALVGGETRYDFTSGPCNVSTDLGGGVASIRRGLEALALKAGTDVESLGAVPACLGLAGVVGPDDAHHVSKALPLHNAAVESDQPSTVEGALGGEDGAVAGLGTGSFFGLRVNGELKLAGGWGSRIDDRASGFWLGQQALRAALEAYDGRAAQSAVSSAVFERFGTPATIVAFARDAGPEDIAGLSRCVTDRPGDPVASAILAAGTAHIMEALAAMGWTETLPLCAIGGVAVSYGPMLERRATLIDANGTPLDGAIARARRFAEGAL